LRGLGSVSGRSALASLTRKHRLEPLAERQLIGTPAASQLTVEAKDGNVSIAGTVPSQPQYQRIEPLAKEIYGVKNVAVKVTVVPAKPKS
jgi:hypothetical protein